MLDRVTSPARSDSIYLLDDLSLDRAAIFRRAHEAARNLRASQIARFKSGACKLEPESYAKIFADKLRREMGNAVEARESRRFWAAPSRAQRTAAYDFAARVMGNGSI